MRNSKSKVGCWNCGTENTIVYGKGGEELFRCDECDEIIAKGGVDTLTIVESEQYKDYLEEEISELEEETSGECDHPPDRIIPYSYSKSPNGDLILAQVVCLQCTELISAYDLVRR